MLKLTPIFMFILILKLTDTPNCIKPSFTEATGSQIFNLIALLQVATITKIPHTEWLTWHTFICHGSKG